MTRPRFIAALLVAFLALAAFALVPAIARADDPLGPIPDGYGCPDGSESLRVWLGHDHNSMTPTVVDADLIAAFGEEQGNRWLDGMCMAPSPDDWLSAPGAGDYCPDEYLAWNDQPQDLVDFGTPGVYACRGYLPTAAWDGFVDTPPTTTTTTSTTTTTTPALTGYEGGSGEAHSWEIDWPAFQLFGGAIFAAVCFAFGWRWLWHLIERV